MRLYRPALIAIVLCHLSAGVHASEHTDVIDALDGDDPYDFTAEIKYSRQLKRAKITREYNCRPLAGDASNPDRETCVDTFNRLSGTVPDPDSPRHGDIVHVKELRYERVTHWLTPTFRFGIWHDLELRIDAPIVLTDEQDLRFAGNGGDSTGVVIRPACGDPSSDPLCGESSVAPGEKDGVDEVDLVPIPIDLPKRAGFGDMTFTLRWQPYAQERDEMRADWTVELGYRAPTGEHMENGNEAVGNGVHEIILATAMSRRMGFFEPYGRIDFVQPFEANDSLFKDYGDAQEHTGPGFRTGIDTGMEIVPYQDPERGLRFFIDLGLGMTYHAEGRNYTELFDALALGAQACNTQGIDRSTNDGSVNCGYYNSDSRSSLAGQPHDGITTVEEFMTFRSALALGFHASEYLTLIASVGIAHETEHHLSSAQIGKDFNNSGSIDPNEANEQNPTYVSAIDAVGRRLRIEETTIFTSGFTAKLNF